MYRSRLGKNLGKVTLDYVSSLNDDMEIALYDILGSQAHTIMLYEKKIITKKEIKKILKGLENLKKEKFEKKSSSEDIHELIESLIIKRIGIDAGGKMHTARSRNDQVALDIRMKIRDDINIVCQCLLDTIKSLVLLAKKHQETIIPLYTHLQQAQVGVFSHYLLSYADALFRDLDRLYVTYGRVNENPLGAGPIGGTSIPIDRQSTGKMLGLKGIVENSIDATTTRDSMVEYISAVAILMTNLSRISKDFSIWSTSEFSFLELSDEFTSPSSVMPQKKNPDILEITRGKTSQVIGSLTSMLSTIQGLPSGYSRDLQQINPSIWSASKIVISALLIMESMLKTVVVNKKNMKKAAEDGYIIALDLAEKLVHHDIPFRKSHQIIGRLVKFAHKSGKPISKLNESEVKKVIKGKEVSLKLLMELIQSTTITSSLHDRKSQGSSGISEQKRMIKDRMGKINAYQRGIKNRSNQVQNSLNNLNRKVKELTK
ncbi:argininosuccinate lyase [Marine Group I thaumarchaeote]|uniref:Argininosuccinate lyase n=1 Tax=Marine Group I thaumarchaeote TaxID=2511932 RepID=A0A7K4NLA2_9ARCH|nr:argininosuccinate lyase [Marine Group I thaumarchaeote]